MNGKIYLYRKFTGTAALLIISRCLAVISGVIYARYLGPEQFGLYSFVLAIITIATLPVIAGLPNLLVREIANFHLEKKWSLLIGVINWSRCYVLILSSIIIILISCTLYFGTFNTSLSNLLCIAILLIPLKGILSQQGAILNGFKQPIFAQLPTKIFAPSFRLLILFFFIWFNIELTGKMLINISILASLFAFFVSVYLLRKTCKLSVNKLAPEYTIKNWHASLLPFSFIAFISSFNTVLASLLLGWFADNESVAYFKVAIQGVALIAIGLSSINAVIRPNIASYYKQGELDKVQELLTRSVRLSVVVSLPIILTLMFYGDFLIRVLFSSEYIEAYPILVILCIGQLVNVLMGSVGLVLNMTGNEKSTVKSLLITVIVNVIFMVILLPVYGAIGAAIAVSVSMVLWNILMAIDVWKMTKLKTWL